MYDRSDPDGFREIDRWDGGLGWLSHPDETARRAGHAVVTDDGVWVFDPLDAPGVETLLDELGDVVGVAVLSDYHTRDAGAFARRYDVPVTVPAWLGRVPGRLDCPVDRVEKRLAGFELEPLQPLSLWSEAVAYRESDGTLYVPDYLRTIDAVLLEDERLGLHTLGRVSPSWDVFAGRNPERVLVGHGTGISEDATAALTDAFDGARRRLPRALVSNLPSELRAMIGAISG